MLHTVPQHIELDSLVDYCINAYPMLGSRSAVKKAIFKEQLFLNDQPAKLNDRVTAGDRLMLQKQEVRRVRNIRVSLDVIFEDEYILVVNKPGGMAVNGLRDKTVENAVAGFNTRNKMADALDRPIAVHRIDVPTSGLVVLAKTKNALIKLSEAFQKKRIEKEYSAVVHGKAAATGMIVEDIEGKKSITEYQLIESVPSRVFGHLSLLNVKPLTGRTHQIRLHLKSKGHLIVGDKMYAERQKTILGKGLLLCARKLKFKHPVTGEKIELEIPIPAKYHKVLDREKSRF